MRPFISVVTPTYNRREFIPILIEIYKNQTYPHDRMEWIILDDGPDRVEDLFLEASKTIPNIRYLYQPNKLLIGAKRNILNREAKGEIIVAMDDDDYYPPERVAHVVNVFARNKSIEMVGSSQMYMYYIDTHKIGRIGPFWQNHATNGTMAWRRSYAKTHKYDETVKTAEEKSFLNDFTTEVVQLDPLKTILVICHSSNTYDKKILRDGNDTMGTNPTYKESPLKLRDFVKEPKIRSFYSKL